MKARLKSLDQALRAVATPKFILFALALWNFLAVPGRFDGLCFYNWSDAFYVAFTILVAASALWVKRWWGYVGAIIAGCPVIYVFSYMTLQVFSIIPSSHEEWYVTPEIWFDIMRRHPEEWMQPLLAFAILCFAAGCLVMKLLRKQRFTM